MGGAEMSVTPFAYATAAPGLTDEGRPFKSVESFSTLFVITPGTRVVPCRGSDAGSRAAVSHGAPASGADGVLRRKGRVR